MKYQLAQLNIAQARADLESELMSAFVARLDEINGLADRSPGFVWRWVSEDGDDTGMRLFGDPMLIVNLSVWESLEDLRNFVYRSDHVELIRDREAWFNKLDTMHQVLWWIPAGRVPTVDEARVKLELIRANGAGSEAFTFGKPFPRPSGP